MKRKHPDKRDLFWCPYCEQFKNILEFKTLHDYQPCKMCHTEYGKQREANFKIQQKNQAEAAAKYREKNKNRMNEIRAYHRETLSDQYVKQRLNYRCKKPPPELIELKRQQITMERTMEKLKQWREENDTIVADVSGI